MNQQKENTASQATHWQNDLINVAHEEESEHSTRPCYQCGTCTGGCPIAKRNADFNPRRIVQRFLMKREDKIPRSTIWLCLLCHTCIERCPQAVKPSEVIVALRNKATQDGDVKDYFRDELKQVYATGWTVPLMPAITKRRETLGLPPAPTANVEEVRRIIDTLGLDKLIREKKEGETEK